MEIKETQESQRPGRPSAAPKGSNRKEPRLEKLGGKKRFYIIGERERKREQKHNKKCVPASNSLHVVHFGETERQREPFIDDRKNAKYFRPRQTYLRQLQHGPDPLKKKKKKKDNLFKWTFVSSCSEFLWSLSISVWWSWFALFTFCFADVPFLLLLFI